MNLNILFIVINAFCLVMNISVEQYGWAVFSGLLTGYFVMLEYNSKKVK